MSGRRGIIAVGGIAAAAGGYYFYQAGGDPKVAKKEVERKLHATRCNIPITQITTTCRRLCQCQSFNERPECLQRRSKEAGRRMGPEGWLQAR